MRAEGLAETATMGIGGGPISVKVFEVDVAPWFEARIFQSPYMMGFGLKENVAEVGVNDEGEIMCVELSLVAIMVVLELKPVPVRVIWVFGVLEEGEREETEGVTGGVEIVRVKETEGDSDR